MDPAAMKPFGLALLDLWRGDKSASFTIIRDDGLEVEVAVSTFFRGPDEFTDPEKTVLHQCRGHDKAWPSEDRHGSPPTRE